MPILTKTLRAIGIFPIRDHYYEPLFNDAHLKKPLNERRPLPGVDLRHEAQVKFLKKLTYQEDFNAFLDHQKTLHGGHRFELKNSNFGPGDSEFLFNMVRHIKPAKVIEIGCGSSTKIIAAALEMNAQEKGQKARHICIEPFEQPWLEQFENIELIRSNVEDVPIDLFQSLGSNDFLFIDSSHIIRPQGDVLFEYLQILPSLSKGVYVHVHDIFTPRDYTDSFVKEKILFWNEQYLLEAFLSNNSSFKVIAALYHLKHEEPEALQKVCPHQAPRQFPGSFYIQSC